MIGTKQLSETPLRPHKPGTKLPVGPTDLRDPGGRAFAAAWLAHVEAGRIGVRQETPEDIRAITLANERLICGDRARPRG